METPTETTPGAATTGDLTRLAAQRLGQSASRRARTGLRRAVEAGEVAGQWVRGHRRATGSLVLAVALLAASALAWSARSRPSASSEPAGRDLVSLLVQTRQGDRIGAGAAAAVEHARAAVAMGEYGELLEALEIAVKTDPALAHDEDFLRLSLQSFNAGKPARSQYLMQSADRKTLEPLLQSATADYSYRIRHGAAKVLEAQGSAVADPVPMLLLDVWQLERCDARRAVASKLIASSPGDLRVTGGLDAAARRPMDEGCLKGLVRVSGR